MPLIFYTLSGSPFSWKVWLALEHKQIPYEMRLLSADAGDLRSPAFLAINPRGKAPAISDGEFTLAESSVVVEYLEDRYSDCGPSLWPAHPGHRAFARRLALEGDNFIYPSVRKLVLELLSRKTGTPDQAVIDEAKTTLERELFHLASSAHGAFLAGQEPSAADYALYPFLAILQRIAARQPAHAIGALTPRSLRAWMALVEELPYFARTIPPHWKSS